MIILENQSKGRTIVNKLQEYFYTDWSVMTSNDWVGLIITVVIFILMIAIYSYVLAAGNQEKFDACRYIPFDSDDGDNNKGVVKNER